MTETHTPAYLLQMGCLGFIMLRFLAGLAASRRRGLTFPWKKLDQRGGRHLLGLSPHSERVYLAAR